MTLLFVVPIFVILFLNVFGNNRYDIPYAGPKMVNSSGDTLYHKIAIEAQDLVKDDTRIKVVLYGDFDDNLKSKVLEYSMDTNKVQIRSIKKAKIKEINWLVELTEWMKNNRVKNEVLYTKGVLLIDSKNYLRGMYNPSESDLELLLLETDILLDQLK